MCSRAAGAGKAAGPAPGLLTAIPVSSRADPDPDTAPSQWLRLHALSGAIPLAGYVVLHLLTQASVFGGAEAYARFTRAIDALPALVVFEILVIYLPLSFHVAVSAIRLRARPVDVEGWAGPWGRRLQLASGVVLLIFLVVHFWQFRWRLWMGELSRSDFYPELCASLSSTASGGIPWVALGYLVGVTAAAFHAAQGLHHAAAPWASRRGRPRLLARCCGALGFGLFVLGALIVIDLATGSVLIHFPG